MPFAGFSGSALPRQRDDFVRADGALGANWTVGDFNALEISSNKVRQGTAAAENGMYWNGHSSRDFGFCYTLDTFGASDYAHYMHIDAPDQAYQFQLYLLASGSQAELYGGGGIIHSATGISATFAAGDRIGCRITWEGQDDSRLRLYRQAGATGSWSAAVYNYLVVGSVSGPYYGGIGIYDSASARVTDFRAEAVISGGNAPEYGQAKSGQQNNADLQTVLKGAEAGDGRTTHGNRSWLGWDVATDEDGNPTDYTERGPYV